MTIAIILLTLFVLLVIEIPFKVFLNFSIDRILLEYMVESPIKVNGYAYLKDGMLHHGNKKKSGGSGGFFSLLLRKSQDLVIVKSLHVRGILGDEDMKNTMLQCVIFESIVNGIFGFVKSDNPFADMSESYLVDNDADSNIFVETKFWFSVMDIIFIGCIYIFNVIKNRRGKNGV